MKISHKLVLLFLLIILPLIFVPVYLYRTINQSLKVTQYVMNHDLPVQNNSRDLERLISEIHSEYQIYVNSGDSKSLNSFMNLQTQFDTLFERQISLLKGNLIESRRLRDIKKLQDEWFIQAGVPSIVQRVDENKRSISQKTYADPSFTAPILDEIHQQFSLANYEQEKLSQERKQYAENLTDSLYKILVITLSLVFIGFAMFLLAVMRIYVQPLKRLIEVSRSILEGNMSQRAVVHSSDEIGELEMIFNKLIEMVQHSHLDIEERVNRRYQSTGSKHVRPGARVSKR